MCKPGAVLCALHILLVNPPNKPARLMLSAHCLVSHLKFPWAETK